MNVTVTVHYQDVEMVVTGDYSPLIPAKTSGPWEHCHEEEGGEFDVERIEVGGVDMTELLMDAYYPAVQHGKVILGEHLVSRITDLAYDAAVVQAKDDAESDAEDLASWRASE